MSKELAAYHQKDASDFSAPQLHDNLDSVNVLDPYVQNRVIGIYFPRQLEPYIEPSPLPDKSEPETDTDNFPHTRDFLNKLNADAGSVILPVLNDEYFKNESNTIYKKWKAKNLPMIDLRNTVAGLLMERGATIDLISRQTSAIRVVAEPTIRELYSNRDFDNYFFNYLESQDEFAEPDIVVLRPLPEKGYTRLEGIGEITMQKKLCQRKKKQLKLHEDGTIIEQLFTDPTHPKEWTSLVEKQLLSSFPDIPQKLVFEPDEYHPFFVLPRSSNERPGAEYLSISRKELLKTATHLSIDIQNEARNLAAITPPKTYHFGYSSIAAGD